MLNYVLKRLAVGVLVIISASIVLFSIMQLMPGDPIRMVADPRLPPHRIEELKRAWGLDKPAYVQYLYWMKNLLRGDMGTSIATGQPVGYLIASRLPYTLLLAGTAMVVRYLIGVPLGLIAALRQGTKLDRLLVMATTMLMMIPGYWFAILLMMVFAIKLRWLPISGFQGPASLVLPLMTMVLPGIGGTLRVTRSEVLDTAREPFVLTAHAKGLSARAVQVYHILRNALIPVTVSFFLNLPWLISGSVIIENVFAWPGMGRLVWGAIQSQDLPVVQGVFVMITALTVVCNIVGDIVAGLLDPRIRVEIEEARE
ncbi:MAG TPA: ABC transporter permease [Firmicutes bacterium]|nr:ABC transporter permease [Candidatus Fermentithermobacillaceae bacterium]